MIRMIKGIVVDKTMSSVVLQTESGIGFEVFTTLRTIESLRLNEETLLHTYLQVKEDGMSLFGFSSKDELAMFKLLITVSGVGPKTATGILSAIKPEDLQMSIAAEDKKVVSKLPGIGPKTAAKLILELKDKVGGLFAENIMMARSESPSMAIREEAKEALVALGYSPTDAAKAVCAVEINEDDTTNKVLSKALRMLTR